MWVFWVFGWKCYLSPWVSTSVAWLWYHPTKGTNALRHSRRSTEVGYGISMTFKTTPTQRNWLNQVDSSIMSHIESLYQTSNFRQISQIFVLLSPVIIHHLCTYQSILSIADTFYGQNSAYSASMNAIAKPHLRRKTTLGNFHAFDENL